jgi:hypothetical protein
VKRALVGLYAMVLVALAACSGSKLTPQDEANLAAYSAQQSACVVAHAPDQTAIDACRAQVRAQWVAKWQAQFDGGFPVDAASSDAGGQ